MVWGWREEEEIGAMDFVMETCSICGEEGAEEELLVLLRCGCVWGEGAGMPRIAAISRECELTITSG